MLQVLAFTLWFFINVEVDLERLYENVKPSWGIFYGQGVNTVQGLLLNEVIGACTKNWEIKSNQSRRSTCCVIV